MQTPLLQLTSLNISLSIRTFSAAFYFYFSYSWTSNLISLCAFCNESLSFTIWSSLCFLYCSILSSSILISSFLMSICLDCSSICDVYDCMSSSLNWMSWRSSSCLSFIFVTSCSTNSMTWSLSLSYSFIYASYS